MPSTKWRSIGIDGSVDTWEHDPYLTPRERRLASLPLDAPDVDPTLLDEGHGTSARYRKHYRDGDKPCSACVEAEVERRRKTRGQTRGLKHGSGTAFSRGCRCASCRSWGQVRGLV